MGTGATTASSRGGALSCTSCDVRSCCFGHDADMAAVEQLNGAVARRFHIEAGASLYRKGDPFHSLYSIRSGCLKHSVRDDRGREHVMGFHLVGDVVGVAGIGGDSYIFDVSAVESSELCEIPFERLEKLASQVPALSRNIIRVFGRYRSRDARTLSLRREADGETRVAGFILDLHRRLEGRGGEAGSGLRLPMSDEDIGSYLCLGAAEVDHEIRRLAERGILTVSGRAIVVSDAARLGALASARDE